MSSPGTTSDARDALLEAARDELIDRGVAALGLRAVARRAGLSHAAPGYFFGDRAGMLTALATAGWDELAGRLVAVEPGDGELALTRLGEAYVGYGLANAALYDLMTTSDVLHAQDPGLGLAQQRAIAPLLRATEGVEQTPLDADELGVRARPGRPRTSARPAGRGVCRRRPRPPGRRSLRPTLPRMTRDSSSTVQMPGSG